MRGFIFSPEFPIFGIFGNFRRDMEAFWRRDWWKSTEENIPGKKFSFTYNIWKKKNQGNLEAENLRENNLREENPWKFWEFRKEEEEKTLR